MDGKKKQVKAVMRTQKEIKAAAVKKIADAEKARKKAASAIARKQRKIEVAEAKKSCKGKL